MKKSKKELISLIVSKTLMFIVVVLLVSMFKSIFGEENSLIGVTSIVLMLVFLETNLTLSPSKNLFGLIGMNLIFGLSAFLVSQNLFLGLIINFTIILFIAYRFSYELKKPLNVLILLHYVLILVNPITASQLPLRLLSLSAGSLMIMAAQLLANKNKLIKSRKKILNSILDSILLKIELLKSNTDTKKVDTDLTISINQLKLLIFDSGKIQSHLTECAINTINILSCLEKINTILSNTKNSNINTEILDEISTVLKDVKAEKFDINTSNLENEYKDTDLYLLDVLDIYDFINSVKILNMEIKKYSKLPNNKNDTNNQLSIPNEFKELNIQKRLINIKSTRFSYAIRLAVIFSLTFFIINLFNIEFGEWALYTVFVLTQPLSEYSISKSKKRIVGTLIGSAIIAVLFNLVPNPEVRTIILVASGYLMSYMSDYRDLVIFITISSIASAALNVVNPNFIILNRIVFILIGVAIALIANKFILHRNISDEDENLNTIQKQSSTKFIEEILLNIGSENENSICLLSLVPSLIDLKIGYLKQYNIDISNTFISINQTLMNDLHQIHLLEKYDKGYSDAFFKVKESIKNSTSVNVLKSKIQESIKSTNNLKEIYLFIKVSKMLGTISTIDYNEENQTNLYKTLVSFN